jgi:arginyl-tRNA synthetase
MRHIIEKLVFNALQSLSIEAGEVSIEHPENIKNGDYTTNAALVYGKKTSRKPVELALELIEYLDAQKPPQIERVEVAGPGFINFYLAPEFFAATLSHIIEAGEKYGQTRQYLGKKVMVEYTDPNPFKIFHIGHLMSNTIGEAIARLIEWNGAEVKRACYQGDVGRHVALTLWGVRFLDEAWPAETVSLKEKVSYLGRAYVAGSKKFAADEAAHMAEVQEINKKIYEHSDAELNALYDEGREWSLEYFETIYERLGTKFDYYFFESQVAEDGVAIVKDFLKQGIFEESDGAVVFKAEKYDPKLHTRVFINSHGLPTYEAKDLGLNTKKYALYPFDRSIIITANEQDDYFRVVLKALELTFPEIAQATTHMSHGILKLPTGKMSSRTGDVVAAETLLEDVESRVQEKVKERDLAENEKKQIAEEVGIAALKYTILKQMPGRDIVFDFDKSLSFEGDSGPYLQYAHTRAHAVLEKAKTEHVSEDAKMAGDYSMPHVEKILHRLPELIDRAGKEYSPQLIVGYLIDLAGAFNSFYAQEKIVDKADPHSPHKVALTHAVEIVLKNGLAALGIKAPKKM